MNHQSHPGDGAADHLTIPHLTVFPQLIMPEIVASFISNFIVAGPLACGLLATCFAHKVFHDSWATCIVIGIVAAILVSLVFGPMHKERNPHLYDTRDHSLLGPQPGDKVDLDF